MEIYAEYLFLENFATGLLILILTGKICGRKIKKRRLIAGGVFCGAYSFILLLDYMGFFWAVISKIAFSLVLMFCMFGKKNLGRITLTFYLVSFAMGGITIGIMYFGGLRGITQNTSLYMEVDSYINVAAGVGIAYLIISRFAWYIKQRTAAGRNYMEVNVEVGGKSWSFKALVDTGNFLREPVSGRPVGIICQSAASSVLPMCGPERFCVIPFKAVGMEKGIMEGFRSDRVTADNIVIDKMVLGIYKGEFSSDREEEYQILLHQDIMEGGIAVNV